MAVLAALSGMIVDPVQTAMGLHRRRLHKLSGVVLDYASPASSLAASSSSIACLRTFSDSLCLPWLCSDSPLSRSALILAVASLSSLTVLSFSSISATKEGHWPASAVLDKNTIINKAIR
nr:hypothetical protein [Marinobacter confluentis]